MQRSSVELPSANRRLGRHATHPTVPSLCASQPTSLRSFGRQALHAAVLEFRHPRTGKEMRFATELPQDIRMLVAELNSVK